VSERAQVEQQKISFGRDKNRSKLKKWGARITGVALGLVCEPADAGHKKIRR
jgi:hypothetical protein